MRLTIMPNIRIGSCRSDTTIRASSPLISPSASSSSQSSLGSSSTGHTSIEIPISTSQPQLATNKQTQNNTHYDHPQPVFGGVDGWSRLSTKLDLPFDDRYGWVDLQKSIGAHKSSGAHDIPVVIEGRQLQILQAVTDAAILLEAGKLEIEATQHLYQYACEIQEQMTRDADLFSYPHRLAWMMLSNGAQRFHQVIKAATKLVIRNDGASLTIVMPTNQHLCIIDENHFLSALLTAEEILQRQAPYWNSLEECSEIVNRDLLFHELSHIVHEEAIEAAHVCPDDISPANTPLSGPLLRIADTSKPASNVKAHVDDAEHVSTFGKGSVEKVIGVCQYRPKDFACIFRGKRDQKKPRYDRRRIETHQTCYTSFPAHPDEAVPAVTQLYELVSPYATAETTSAACASSYISLSWTLAVKAAKRAVFFW